MSGDRVKLALPKGRLLEETSGLLVRAGWLPEEIDFDTRQLVIETAEMVLLIARPADVTTYVEQGAADLGVVGKDILLEEEREVYELVDLGVGKCRFVVAAPSEKGKKALVNGGGGLRVATKFPRVAERHFYRRGLHAEIIKVHGNTELAPRVGLSDVIVDLVATGRTLKENGLVVVDEIAAITARLIGNRASLALKGGRLWPLVNSLLRAVEGEALG